MNTDAEAKGGRRYIAVDWSGDEKHARSRIWIAEVRNRTMVRLVTGLDRDAAVQDIIESTSDAREVVVGFDFAFSFPYWFAQEAKKDSVEDIWQLAREKGEEWLQDCDWPFWGRPGKSKPDLPDHFRLTERDVDRRPGSHPKSVFQIGGAGAVGAGSIRGMPHLLELREAGFSIWPFDEPGSKIVIEIYPRLIYGPIRKSDPGTRLKVLEQFPEIVGDFRTQAVACDDAFDAAVAVVQMSRDIVSLDALTRAHDPRLLIEGAIWQPDHPIVWRETDEIHTTAHDNHA